jgi:hypothetical protein
MSRSGNHAEHWPADQWHPAYHSIKDWLDSEAPVSSPLVVEHLTSHTRPRFRLVRRTR